MLSKPALARYTPVGHPGCPTPLPSRVQSRRPEQSRVTRTPGIVLIVTACLHAAGRPPWLALTLQPRTAVMGAVMRLLLWPSRRVCVVLRGEGNSFRSRLLEVAMSWAAFCGL